MRRFRAVASLVALVGALGLISGCVNSSEDEARTPSGADTVVNSAPQTDSKGDTVSAPAGGETSAPTDTAAAPGGDTAVGDAAAGETFFAATCSGCHMDNGKAAGGVGPKLAGLALTADLVKTTVTNGRGVMPPGLASGTDLDNVTAYVLSLQ